MPEPRLIRGILLSRDFDRLVVQATAAEVMAFGKHEAVTVAPTMPERGRFDPSDRFLYNSQGQIVALVVEVQQHMSAPVDITSYGDTHQVLLPGRSELTIRVVGYP